MAHRSSFRPVAVLFVAFAALATTASAQQNLFNVPSGVITPQGELFFQQQFNLGRRAGTSNTSTAFGLGGGWEAGFNFLNLYMYDTLKPAATDADAPRAPGNPDLMGNLQKGFKVTDFWNTAVGTQLGFNPSRHEGNIYFQNFSWWTNAFEFPGHEALGKWYAGAYYANQNYSGEGNRYGALVGLEIPVIQNRFSIQCDGIMGHNDLSVLVFGGVYTFKNHWQLSLGAQVPRPASGNAHGLVIELTYPGLPLHKKRR